MLIQPFYICYLITGIFLPNISLGPVKAAMKHALPLSVEWAKLEQCRETTVGEFIDQVKDGQTSDYLFDWSLPIHCPQLAEDLSLPKYFSGR